MKAAILTVVFLIVANVFMTFAWYGHLKLQSTGVSSNWPLYTVILISWGIALVEYCFQVPANRMGFDGNGGPYSLIQLKVMQEAITLIVFTIFSVLMFEGTVIRWNHILAFLLLIAAVYLVFMKRRRGGVTPQPTIVLALPLKQTKCRADRVCGNAPM